MIEVEAALSVFETRWAHLKNYEDYGCIFQLESSLKTPLDSLYCDGRQFAGDLRECLLAFTDVTKAPTLSKYVEALDQRLAGGIPDQEVVLRNAETAIQSWGSPGFAVPEMVRLLRQQIELARVVKHNGTLLKRTPKYLIEKGKLRPGEEPARFWQRPLVIALSATLLAGALTMFNTYLSKEPKQRPIIHVHCDQPPSIGKGMGVRSGGATSAFH